MKQNYFLRTAALLLAACMFCLCTVTGTLAKYTKPFIFNSERARAGVFRVEVLKSSDPDVWAPLATGTSVTINLFDTLTESSIGMAGPSSTAEQAAHVDLGLKVIAPGTGGAFKVSVRNQSEVDVWVTVGVAGGGTFGPIEWYTTAWQSEFPGGETPAPVLLDTPFKVPPLTSKHDVTFYWRWIFDGDDGRDTTDGKAQPTYTIPVTITAWQAD